MGCCYSKGEDSNPKETPKTKPEKKPEKTTASNRVPLHNRKALSANQLLALHASKGDISPETTHGLVRFTLLRAELPEIGNSKVHATVSVGLQSFLSSSVATNKPEWNQGHDFVLQQSSGGAVTQITIFKRRNKHSKGEYMCYGTVDLKQFFDKELGMLNNTVEKAIPLLDPLHASKQLGTVWIKIETATIEKLEETLWRRLLKLVDANGDNLMQLDEFKTLMVSLGNELDGSSLEEIYSEVDANKDGDVSVEELAAYLTTIRTERGLHFLKQCPVSGADLTALSDYSRIVYIHLAMDDRMEESLMGGYQTAEEANRTWMLKLSEWAAHPLGGTVSHIWQGNKYEAGGLNVGTGAAHILIWDREKGLVLEERISATLLLAMRNLYQSPFGRGMLATGAPQIALREMSESKGKYMQSPESVKDIQPFLKSFQGVINMDEYEVPEGGYPNFNEFFYRRLKADARPISAPDNPAVLVSAADCRLITFPTVEDSTRLWIKGKRFSVPGLLGDHEGKLSLFKGGSVAIFRLAPQDYHRFHFPVSGVVQSITHIPGHLYTVNPVAVNAYDVYTENQRVVCLVDSPEFGLVAVVCIGATLVGSIGITAVEGKSYTKGDEMGYYAFGGSTNVAVFQPGTVKFDDDLLEHSGRSLETLVKMGTSIGVATQSKAIDAKQGDSGNLG